MDPAGLPALPELLSPARFAPYLAACEGDVQQAIRLYTWNVQVTSAFWGPLHVVEVVLRNALHDRLTAHFGEPDWWQHPRARLHATMIRERDAAIMHAERVAERHRRAVMPGDVVAQLNFGFWTGLIGNGRGLQYETRYWQPALSAAFPGYTGTRPALHGELDTMRLFRNRLAHHEPVIRRHLAADHETLLRLAGYLNTDVRTYIASHSRVPAVLALREHALATGEGTSF